MIPLREVKKLTTVYKRRRKRRKGEINCDCKAYEFPHRMFGGYCRSNFSVEAFFQNNLCGACKGCHFLQEEEADYALGRGGVSCQVVEGLEPEIACPELQEFIRYNEIKLYGNVAKQYQRKK